MQERGRNTNQQKTPHHSSGATTSDQHVKTVRRAAAHPGVSGGNGKQLNVPVSDLGFSTSKGSAVKWDAAKAKKLFTELRNDGPVSMEEKD